MNKLLQLPAAEATDDAWIYTATGQTLIGTGEYVGGFRAVAANRLVRSPDDRDPIQGTRHSLYASGVIDVLPPAGAVNSTVHTNSRFWDAPKPWGRPGGLIRPPRCLVVNDLSIFEATALRNWMVASWEAEFAPKNLTVVYRRKLSGDGQAGTLFTFGLPLSYKELVVSSTLDAQDYVFSCDTDESLYAGGEMLCLSVTADRKSFGTTGNAYADYTHQYLTDAPPPPAENGAALTYPVAVNNYWAVFTGRAAADRAVLARGAAKFEKFRHCFLQVDAGTAPVPEGTALDLIADSPYLGLRRFTSNSIASLSAAVLAEVQAFWP